jgi:cell division transport system permease protein
MSRGASRVDRRAETTKDKPRAVGATQSKKGLVQKFRSYLAHHRSSLATSYARLLASPMQSLLTALVVAIALTLPALLILSLQNLQALGGNWDASPRLTLFLKEGVSDAARENFERQLSEDVRVADFEYLSQEQALDDFQRLSGFGDVLESLDNNPLPASYEISPASELASTDQQAALAQTYQEHALVEDVLIDMAWVQRFNALTELAEKVVYGLAALLCLGALLAIGNTVRLVIESRKEEIVVIKLVGGTDGFVRRPLLYTGGLYGLAGALLSCLIIALAVTGVEATIEHLVELYQSEFRLHGLSFIQMLGLLGLGAVLGWLGALLAVGRHLRAIEPT